LRYTFVAVIIFLPVFLGSGCLRSNQSKVCFKKHCFYVELAQTPAEKMKGLMFREHLASDRGMLFVYEEERARSFWMKNSLIPLDIIWINQNREVVLISEDIPPCEKDPCPTISPDVKAKYVLEINARKARRVGLRLGDKLDIFIKQ
jgi:uncharacterized membrane protein (UPF0127 family)